MGYLAMLDLAIQIISEMDSINVGDTVAVNFLLTWPPINMQVSDYVLFSDNKKREITLNIFETVIFMRPLRNM
jgi:hypothetical protein